LSTLILWAHIVADQDSPLPLEKDGLGHRGLELDCSHF